jgi:hypothetical protein
VEHTAVTAIIFLPASFALDSLFARQCMEHVSRRGYKLLTIVQQWPVVEQLLRDGRAQVVVFASQDHWSDDWSPRVEFVGEDTVDLVRLGRSRPRNDRRAGDDRSRRPRIAH